VLVEVIHMSSEHPRGSKYFGTVGTSKYLRIITMRFRPVFVCQHQGLRFKITVLPFTEIEFLTLDHFVGSKLRLPAFTVRFFLGKIVKERKMLAEN
jgi:hypothetical protein